MAPAPRKKRQCTSLPAQLVSGQGVQGRITLEDGTRALVDLLNERGLLALAALRVRVQTMSVAASPLPGVLAALADPLAVGGPAVPAELN